MVCAESTRLPLPGNLTLAWRCALIGLDLISILSKRELLRLSFKYRDHSNMQTENLFSASSSTFSPQIRICLRNSDGPKLDELDIFDH